MKPRVVSEKRDDKWRWKGNEERRDQQTRDEVGADDGEGAEVH